MSTDLTEAIRAGYEAASDEVGSSEVNAIIRAAAPTIERQVRNRIAAELVCRAENAALISRRNTYLRAAAAVRDGAP